MKLKSLFLGSVAAAGLSTAGFAADLGVLTSLDVCDELGLAGLTISSDTNCLQISGDVEYDFTITDDRDGDGDADTTSDIDASLTFVATSASDLGPASATISFELAEDGDATSTAEDVDITEAFVSIGDTTILTVGLVDDGSLVSDEGGFESFGGFFDEDGAEFETPTGGHAIQLETLIADGISAGIGFEDLQGDITAVGFVQFAGGGGISGYVDAFVAGLIDGDVDSYGIKSTIIAELDMFEVVLDGGVEAFDDDTYNYDVSLGVSTEAGAFHLAAYGAANGTEVDDSEDYTIGAEIGYDVTETVAVYIGARYNTEGYDEAEEDGYKIEAGMVVALTETLSANASIGYDDTLITDEAIYAGVGLDWSPNADFEANINLDVYQTGAYEVSFGATKSFE